MKENCLIEFKERERVNVSTINTRYRVRARKRWETLDSHLTLEDGGVTCLAAMIRESIIDGGRWMENREARIQSELEVGKLSSETLSRAGSSAGVESAKRELEWGCKRGLTSRGKRRTEIEDKRGGTRRNVQGFKKGKASITFLDLDNIRVLSITHPPLYFYSYFRFSLFLRSVWTQIFSFKYLLLYVPFLTCCKYSIL